MIWYFLRISIFVYFLRRKKEYGSFGYKYLGSLRTDATSNVLSFHKYNGVTSTLPLNGGLITSGSSAVKIG